jgi:hypothetical protein
MECSICFDDITKQTGSTTLSCDHAFHFRCINNWFVKQFLDDLPQTCPCCRNEGGQLDRAIFDEEDENNTQEEDADEDYEDEESETASDTDSLDDLSFNDVMRGNARWQRIAEGQYVIILPHGMEAMAYEGVRSLFGPLNELDVEEDSRDLAARKIQAIFRGHQLRNKHRAAMTLYRLYERVTNI